MSEQKAQTLEEIRNAINIVEEARSESGLRPEEKIRLEKASAQLSSLERAIIRQVNNELVASLKADANALQTLTDEIKTSSDKLSNVADAIKKATKIVESFIEVITTAT